MWWRLSRFWRLVRTAVAFSLFGVGGAFFALVALPLGRFFSRDRAHFDLTAQRWIRWGYRVFMGYMVGARVCRVRWIGAERLERPGLLVVANHPTLIDTPLVGAQMLQADCIVNNDWANNRFMGPAIRAANYIRHDLGAAVIAEACHRLVSGRSVLIFPEGTRTPEGKHVGPMQRGAAHIALQSGAEIVPVVITCEPRTLMKGRKWHQVTDRAFLVTARVLDPLAPKDYLSGGEGASLAARKVTAALRAVFDQALSGRP